MHFYRLEEGRLIFTGANPAADRILGVENAAFVGRSITEAFPALEKTDIPARYKSVVETGKPWETQQVSYSEGRISGAYRVTAFRTGPDSMAAAFTDITEKVKYERKLLETAEELKKSLRLYRMLSRINRAAAKTQAHDTLYGRICETAVEEGGFRLAWVGVPDKYTGRLAPARSAGQTGNYLKSLDIPLEEPADRPPTSHPAWRAATGGHISVCMDISACPGAEPWKTGALAMGCGSCASVPLSSGGKLTAVISLYSMEQNWFTEDELSLLETIKADCELAMDAISSEEKRLATEAALKRTLDHLNHVMETLPAVIFQLRRMGNIFVPVWLSGSVEAITGYDPSEMLSPEWFQAVTFEKEHEAVKRDAERVFKEGVPASHDFRLRRKDGRVIWLHAQLKRLDEGTGEILGSWTDVTQLKELLDGPAAGDRKDG